MPSDPSMRFVMSMFSKHYREVPLSMPDRFARREFGFMFFDRTFVMRHLSFPTRASLKKYLAEQVPSHAYYSCAYYERPDAPKMADKNWLGADLIFDLDADHVEGTKGLPYEKMLDRVKEEVVRLIDEFLLGDLGFDEGSLKVAFSGGRGYHVHINDPRVMRLTSHERREIVDYVTGTDLDIDWVFPTAPFEARRFKDKVGTEYRRDMPRLEEGGWRRRMRRGIDDLLTELEALEEGEAAGRVSEALSASDKETGTKTVEGMLSDLFKGSKGKRGVDRMRSEGTFEVFSQKRHGDAFLKLVEMRVKGRMRGETDEPVTSDVKRLIRLPSSLHGKTGFQVVPMRRDDLDGFDPFVSAVPEAFGAEEVAVSCEKPAQVRLKDRTYSLGEGRNEVPAFVAVHLLCRRLARLDTN